MDLEELMRKRNEEMQPTAQRAGAGASPNHSAERCLRELRRELAAVSAVCSAWRGQSAPTGGGDRLAVLGASPVLPAY